MKIEQAEGRTNTNEKKGGAEVDGLINSPCLVKYCGIRPLSGK